ncbi:toxin-antitoxin system YwqK family antitoxin [Hyunsoonleella aestuarii]|uniref:MORN repeat variant n=1 Tax=Hyunsoonleella aestuarii TaxID=912802 RepID=A0ABP8EAR2_9FLAO|nr:hypothetical protein [Hyunsoonleella aestuarii]
MKKILLLLLFVPTFLIGQSKQVNDTVSSNQLIKKGDLTYKISANKPFTGVQVETLPNGEVSSETHFENGSISLAKTFNNDVIYSIAEYSPESINKFTFYFKSGIKRFERIYDKASRVTSETTWYSDGSKKVEKIYPSAHPMPGTAISLPDEELLLEAMVSKDTLNQDDYFAYEKANNEPFTGVVTFSGELNFNRSKREIFIPHDSYVSAVTFVSGKINGQYTTWFKKNGKKKSELTVTGERARIKGNGPYTHWYPNGQIAITGISKNGKRSGNRTTWHKNGQIKSESYFEFGEPVGTVMAWNENGEKSLEVVYSDGIEIKRIERDKNGNIVKEWPEVDEDNFGLKIFVDNFMTILKTENYDALRKLFASKEESVPVLLKIKEEKPFNEMLESINASWDENVSEKINDIEDQLREHNPVEMLREYNVFYSYNLINDDNSNEKVSWPKSINYDISTATIVIAKIAITHKVVPLKLVLSLCYINNKWCFIATDSANIIQVTY